MLGLLSAVLVTSRGCTTLIAGRDATADGSVLASHSNDGEANVDPRLVHVPARHSKPGSKRPVFWSPESFPRYVGHARNVPEYFPTGGEKAWDPIGFIDEVPHTYAYHEQTYGAINEHGVGIGESTCSGVFAAAPRGRGGKALFSVDQLTQLAMERATTSREAVRLMGELAVAHGFYGADNATEGSAESLMVIDPSEAFIFHVLPDDTGASAIWVAQRVPDDHVGVVANAFSIRAVNLTDGHRFVGSANMNAIARRHGLWDGRGLLDFTAAFSDGEYLHKYYSGRRVWGALHMLAPSLRLSPEYGEWRRSSPYPTTVRPDAKLSVAGAQGVMRSYYEGTQFDQTKGLAAGPWGSPDRAMGGAPLGLVGSWERSIGLFRTSDSHVVQARSGVPKEVAGVLWWGPHAAPTTVYMPFFSGATRLHRALLGTYERLDKASAFWACRYVFNLAQTKYARMIPHVRELQAAQQRKGEELVRAATALAAASPRTAHLGSLVAELSGAHVEQVVSSVWELFDALMFRYADGFVAQGEPSGSGGEGAEPELDTYPEWWLKAVGYAHGPPPVPPGEEGGRSDEPGTTV